MDLDNDSDYDQSRQSRQPTNQNSKWMKLMFANQMELMKGKHLLGGNPFVIIPAKRWSLICAELEDEPAIAPSVDQAFWFDGFDVYPTRENALDTAFLPEDMVLVPDPEYDEDIAEGTYLQRHVFSNTEPCKPKPGSPIIEEEEPRHFESLEFASNSLNSNSSNASDSE